MAPTCLNEDSAYHLDCERGSQQALAPQTKMLKLAHVSFFFSHFRLDGTPFPIPHFQSICVPRSEVDLL